MQDVINNPDEEYTEGDGPMAAPKTGRFGYRIDIKYGGDCNIVSTDALQIEVEPGTVKYLLIDRRVGNFD